MSAAAVLPGPAALLPDDPHRAVGRLIKLVFSSIVRRIDQRMQTLGLTAMQWEPVLLLSLKGVDTVAALARESQVNCSAMTRMLDRLEQKGLVKRRRSDEDRRVVHLELTAKGSEVAQKLMPIVIDEMKHHLRDFSPEEIATLTKFLARMLRNGTCA
jgi:DNA-binding MarR family transcriptional regulator